MNYRTLQKLLYMDASNERFENNISLAATRREAESTFRTGFKINGEELFLATPRELSLLNDRMDRVVEKGQFKICVGGSSPLYVARDRIKDSVGYKNDSKLGLTTMLDYTHEFAADFGLSLAKVEENLKDNAKTLWISVKNNGTLMDTGKLEMYVDGVLTGEKVHFELAPGEEKQIPFKVGKDDAQILFTTKYKSLTL